MRRTDQMVGLSVSLLTAHIRLMGLSPAEKVAPDVWAAEMSVLAVIGLGVAAFADGDEARIEYLYDRLEEAVQAVERIEGRA